MHTPTKNDLLRHYAERKPRRFSQFDGFHVGVDGGDCVFHPDSEGDALCGGVTTELMHGGDVRVLIPASTEPQVAVRLLRKVTDWVERDAKAGKRFAQNLCPSCGREVPDIDIPLE